MFLLGLQMPKGVTGKLVGLAAIMAVTVTYPGHAEDSGCARVTDVDAFVIRDLQSRLMVAGLACGQRAAYNSFVALHETELGRAGRRLKDYFREHSGGQGALDRHVTRSANAASLRLSEDRDLYCARTAALFRDLLGETKTAVANVARSVPLRSVEKPTACMAKAPANADASNQTN